MDEKTLRESIRQAIRKIAGVKEVPKTKEVIKEEKQRFVPEEKEHLRTNKQRLNEALMSKWIPKKKEEKK